MHGSEGTLTDHVDTKHVTAKVDGSPNAAPPWAQPAVAVDRLPLISRRLSDPSAAAARAASDRVSFDTVPAARRAVHRSAAATPKG